MGLDWPRPNLTNPTQARKSIIFHYLSQSSLPFTQTPNHQKKLLCFPPKPTTTTTTTTTTTKIACVQISL